MKIKSGISDGAFIALIVLSIITLATFVYWVISGVWIPAIVLTAIMLLLVVPVFFYTYYELTRTELRLYCGIIGKSIEYRNIISMTDADEAINRPFCLSGKRILIRYMEKDKIKSIYVSPANRPQFRELLSAEMSKTTEMYKKAPKTAEDKAIAKARKKQKTNPEITKAEQRAIDNAIELEKQQQQEILDYELKKLDDVIDDNIENKKETTENVIETVEMASTEKQQKAEQKMLAKIRKLKKIQDHKEKKNKISKPKEKTEKQIKQEKENKEKEKKIIKQHNEKIAKEKKEKEIKNKEIKEKAKKENTENTDTKDNKKETTKKKKVKKINVR